MIQILTLRLDPSSQAHFERLRQEHFPPERNQIPAHLTLFHSLPDAEDVAAALHQATETRAPFALEVTGLRSLGRGVAYTLASPILLELHRELAASLEPHLIAQDRQRFGPHIVVQNKATGEQARELLAKLRNGFRSFTVQAEGLDLWEYLGGPWRLVETLPFAGGK